jgi:hypothetical protein
MMFKQLDYCKLINQPKLKESKLTFQNIHPFKDLASPW